MAFTAPESKLPALQLAIGETAVEAFEISKKKKQTPSLGFVFNLPAPKEPYADLGLQKASEICYDNLV
jgi:hypothetical protein